MHRLIDVNIWQTIFESLFKIRLLICAAARCNRLLRKPLISEAENCFMTHCQRCFVVADILIPPSPPLALFERLLWPSFCLCLRPPAIAFDSQHQFISEYFTYVELHKIMSALFTHTRHLADDGKIEILELKCNPTRPIN